MASNKGRVLFLLKYLMEHTDDTHDVTAADILGLYSKNGFTANIRTTRGDLQELIDADFPIVKTETHGHASYYSYAHPFSVPEIKMIADAVSAARFISESDCRELVSKLPGLAGCDADKGLAPLFEPVDRIHTPHKKIYIHMQTISEAMGTGRKISYQYFNYDARKNKILRNDGETYIYSPYYFVWSEDCYYLLGQLDKRPGIINPIRVDLMENVRLLDEPIAGKPAGFDVNSFMKKVFMMYPGEDCDVTFEAPERLMHKMIERFGQDIEPVQVPPDSYRVTVHVSVSPTFYSWVFQFGGAIRIVSPEKVRRGYVDMLEEEKNRHI